MKILELVVKKPLREGDSGQVVKFLQEALRRAGHELVVDGAFGLITKTAVQRFQAANRIAADGLVGPVTAAFLDALNPVEGISENRPLPSVLAVAPWLSQMRAWTGTKEIPGARSNPLILSWVGALGAKYPTLRRNVDWYTQDATPWCGLAAAAALGLCEPGYKPPDAPLWALNWSEGAWGIELKEPSPGAIMVKKRTGGGHVTLYESEDDRFYYCRGGNQNDQINIASYPKGDFKWIRWPVGALGAKYPAQGRVRRKFTGVAHNPTLA
jgi:uncharacterized protein (TIGR02594 family)